MSKTITRMSIAVDPDMKEKLESNAKKRNISVSALVRDMAEKQLPSQDESDTIILKIPHDIKADSQTLKNWLDNKVQMIVQVLIG